MKRKKLHVNGPELSAIIAGMWRMDEWNLSDCELTDWIKKSIDLGITTFDHADIYGSHTIEEMFGRAINKSLRKKIEIITKCGVCLQFDNKPENRVKHYNSSAGYIRASVEQSLKNFRTDYIDLLLIHRPDPLMDAEETAGALDKLVKEGKVKFIGVSNFSISQIELLQSKLKSTLVTNQVECSLLHTDPIFDGTLDHAQKNSYLPLIWSPLGGGELFSGNSDAVYRLQKTLHELSQKYDAAADQVALAWLIKHPSSPLPITGTGRLDRLAGAAGATELELDRQDWFKLLEAARGMEVL